MADFLMADLNTRGDLQFQQTYSYGLLEQIPGAPDLIAAFSASIWREPQGFEMPLPSDALSQTPTPDLTLRWIACANTAGILSLRQGDELLTLTLLVCGIDPSSDAATLQAYQSHLLQQLRDTSIEPAFTLLDLAHRPLAATINFRSPQTPEQQQIVALTDRCFAASYFRFHQLA